MLLDEVCNPADSYSIVLANYKALLRELLSPPSTVVVCRSVLVRIIGRCKKVTDDGCLVGKFLDASEESALCCGLTCLIANSLAQKNDRVSDLTPDLDSTYAR